MEKNKILEALKELSAQKRNFKQSVDLVINLQNVDTKKMEGLLEFFVPVPHPRGKKITVCALVGSELIDQAKKECNAAVVVDDFERYMKDKKLIKKLAGENNYFIAQATIMPKVASSFGRVLGPKGKMPNPKAGCVVPPNANLKQVVERLQTMIRLNAKKEPIFSCSVGNEGMDPEQIADNVMAVYNQTVHHLPNEVHNIKSVFLKLTMSKPVKVD
ncbi:MAG: 50S ribosomal protein L1 [Nanoarchaeota archaeon]